MKLSIKKAVSYILVSIILIFTIVALLGIWDIVELEHVLRKIMWSLFVIFLAAAVILFIFTVLIKDDDRA